MEPALQNQIHLEDSLFRRGGQECISSDDFWGNSLGNSQLPDHNLETNPSSFPNYGFTNVKSTFDSQSSLLQTTQCESPLPSHPRDPPQLPSMGDDALSSMFLNSITPKLELTTKTTSMDPIVGRISLMGSNTEPSSIDIRKPLEHSPQEPIKFQMSFNGPIYIDPVEICLSLDCFGSLMEINPLSPQPLDEADATTSSLDFSMLPEENPVGLLESMVSLLESAFAPDSSNHNLQDQPRASSPMESLSFEQSNYMSQSSFIATNDKLEIELGDGKNGNSQVVDATVKPVCSAQDVSIIHPTISTSVELQNNKKSDLENSAVENLTSSSKSKGPLKSILKRRYSDVFATEDQLPKKKSKKSVRFLLPEETGQACYTELRHESDGVVIENCEEQDILNDITEQTNFDSKETDFPVPMALDAISVGEADKNADIVLAEVVSVQELSQKDCTQKMVCEQPQQDLVEQRNIESKDDSCDDSLSSLFYDEPKCELELPISEEAIDRLMGFNKKRKVSKSTELTKSHKTENHVSQLSMESHKKNFEIENLLTPSDEIVATPKEVWKSPDLCPNPIMFQRCENSVEKTLAESDSDLRINNLFAAEGFSFESTLTDFDENFEKELIKDTFATDLAHFDDFDWILPQEFAEGPMESSLCETPIPDIIAPSQMFIHLTPLPEADEGTISDAKMSPSETVSKSDLWMQKKMSNSDGCKILPKCCSEHNTLRFEAEKRLDPEHIETKIVKKSRPQSSTLKSPPIRKLEFPNITSHLELQLPLNFAQATPPPGSLEHISALVSTNHDTSIKPPCVYIPRKRYWRDIQEFINLRNERVAEGEDWPHFQVESYSTRNPYSHQIAMCTMDGDKPITSTREGLCPYCPEIRFFNIKNSGYSQHLGQVHGISTKNYFTPVPLFPNVYMLDKLEGRGQTSRSRIAHKHLRPGVVCPCCYQIIEVGCSSTTRGDRPLTKYLNHYKEMHTGTKQGLTKMVSYPEGEGYLK